VAASIAEYLQSELGRSSRPSQSKDGGWNHCQRPYGEGDAARSTTVEFSTEPVVAEAIAALHAAEFSRDLGLQMIILEGDSLQVVNAIQDTGPNWSRYGHIVADIRTVLQGFQGWQICHTKRATNYAAHGLAKEAILNVIDRVWMEEIPSCIYDFVTLEHHALLS
jgi:ribonuclease HI